MIIEFEDIDGNTLGAVKLKNDNIEDMINLSIADADVDDIFDTDEMKYRLQMVE